MEEFYLLRVSVYENCLTTQSSAKKEIPKYPAQQFTN